MHMRLLQLSASAALLLAAVSAPAAGPTSTSDGSSTLAAGNGPADAPVATKRNYGELAASSANSKVSLSIAMDASLPDATLLPTFAVLSATASAPLGSGSSTTQLATLDGLADSANVTLKAVGFWVKTRTPPVNVTNQTCKDIRDAAAWADQNHRPDPGEKKRCNANGLDKTCGADNKEYCCATQNAVLLSCMGLLPSSEADAYTGAHWLSPVTWAGGLSGTVGTKSFQYLDAMSAASAKEALTPWSAQVFGAVQFNESLITAGFKYQVSYKDANTGSLCPSPKSYPVECKSGPVGPPVSTESPQTYLEYRQRLGTKFAIDPTLTYDFKKSVTGVNVPIYFVGDGKGALTGGVSAGWRSDQGGMQFGVFIGSAFSLSPSS